MDFEVEWWYKKVVSHLINLLFSRERVVSYTATGSLWWESKEDLLTQLYSRAVGSGSFFPACSGLTGERTGQMLHLSFAPGAQGCWPATAGEGRLVAFALACGLLLLPGI